MLEIPKRNITPLVQLAPIETARRFQHLLHGCCTLLLELMLLLLWQGIHEVVVDVRGIQVAHAEEVQVNVGAQRSCSVDPLHWRVTARVL